MTVAAIIEAAARILEAEGLVGYTTNLVAEKAGVSIGTLYQYFPDKDAIARALSEREMREIIENVEALTLSSQGIFDFINAVVCSRFRRPSLAHILALEEHRLFQGSEIRAELGARALSVIRACLKKEGVPQASLSCASIDVMTIVRSMIDAAARRHENDAASVASRIAKAVQGYLEA